jgi:hypothetical protein
MPSDRNIIRFVPRPDQLTWTFGGQAAALSIQPGDILDLFTEDAFGGWYVCRRRPCWRSRRRAPRAYRAQDRVLVERE